MISKPFGGRYSRFAAGALVTATTTAILAVPFAGEALAASAAIPATGVQITDTSQNQNVTAGTTATINVTYQPATSDAAIDWVIISGPDQPNGGSTTAQGTCAKGAPDTSGNGTATCTVPASANAGVGTDQVRVFADNNGDGAYTAGEPSAITNVTFSGPIASLALSPDTPTDNANVCQQYTVTANDAQGRPASGYVVDITATQTTPTASGTPLSFCTPTGSTTAQTPQSGDTGYSNANTANPSPATTGTDTLKGQVTTGQNGTAIFGIESSQAGTITITAASDANAAVNDTSTETVTGGQTGNDAVKSLTVQPPSYTGYTGTTASYTVTAHDAANGGGSPVSGAEVDYVITGPDSAPATASAPGGVCGTTASGTGSVTCNITNAGAPGTDNITFYVNQTTQATQTEGPDAGEPTANATAIFTQAPAYTSINVTCPDQTNSGNASGSCTIPTDQHSITFTAHVTNGYDNNENPIPVKGAVVTFKAVAGQGTFTPLTGTDTTDAQGNATFTVTDAAAKAGDNVTVTATIGSGNTVANGGSCTGGPCSDSAKATYQARTASQIVVQPADQTQQNGGTATVVAHVTDQFGQTVSGQTLSFTVSGRNNTTGTTVVTDQNGNASFSYQDKGSNTSTNTDTITVHDNTTPSVTDGTAQVHWIAGSGNPSKVSLNLSSGYYYYQSNNPCPASANDTSATTSDNEQVTTTTAVCALVTNADGTPLAGKTVTFTVDKGFFTDGIDYCGGECYFNRYASYWPDGNNANHGKTVTVVTDSSGEARAYVTSTETGTQTITATAGSASGTATITYSPYDLHNVTLAPPSANVTPGSSQKFTATVKDLFGNPVPGAEITFTQSGPGSIAGGSSGFQITDANGQASVSVSTASSDSGSGSVTVTIDGYTFNNELSNDCNDTAGNEFTGSPAGNCSATSTYTVKAPSQSTTASNPAYRSGSALVLGDQSGNVVKTVNFGNSTDIPLWGDWNGDGTSTAGVFRPSNHTFYLSNNNSTAAIVVSLGNKGDVPLTGDFNGDGIDTIGVYRPSAATFFLTNDNHTVVSKAHYGNVGDIPLIGDWDKSGVSRIGVYRPSTATFYRINFAGLKFGNHGDKPIAGDWNGDGRTTIGVVRGSQWFLSNDDSTPTVAFSFGNGGQTFTWASGASPAAPTEA